MYTYTPEEVLDEDALAVERLDQRTLSLQPLRRCLRLYTESAYVSIRQHTSAYVAVERLDQRTLGLRPLCRCLRLYTEPPGGSISAICACASIRQHTAAYVSISYVSIRQHTSAYVSIRQHTAAYVRMYTEPPGGSISAKKHPRGNACAPQGMSIRSSISSI